MANGDYLTPEELRKYTKPIEDIKTEIDNFAKSQGLEAEYYSRGWPHFALTWKNNNDLDCLIQVFMNDDKETYSLWLAASKDIARERFIKDIYLHNRLTPPFNIQSILTDLRTGLATCNSWKFEDLQLSR